VYFYLFILTRIYFGRHEISASPKSRTGGGGGGGGCGGRGGCGDVIIITIIITTTFSYY